VSEAGAFPCIRLKYISRFDQEKLTDTTDPELEFEYVDVSDVSQGQIALDETLIKFADAPSRARRLAKPGDTVISTVRTYLKAVAQIPTCDRRLVFSTGLSVFHPNRGVNPRWLAYALQSQSFIDEVEARSTGVSYPAIAPQEVASVKLAMPDQSKQVAIAEFLDRETARIDTLIKKQEKLIETLRERRRESISKLVTQGSNESSKNLVPSGIAWLGPIRDGWRVIRARFLVDIKTGSGDTQDAELNGVYPFYVRSDTPLRSSRYEFEGPAVLTAGDGAGVAKVFHLVYDEFMAHQRVYVLDRFRHVLPEFFMAFFSTFFEKVALDGSAKSTVDSVRRHMIADMPVVVPPSDVQQRIVDAINDVTSQSAALITKAERFIELAKERRSALITAAVTGQIEVGEEAPVG